MLLTTAQAAGGFLLLFLGGEALIRGASALAARLGVTPLVIGLTVVAFGTSAPELVVSLDAALSGSYDISIGNVVGSNIANLALILALAAVIAPTIVEARIIRIDMPIVVAVTAIMILMLHDGEASRVDGLILFAGMLSYIAFTFWEAKREEDAVLEVFSDQIAPQTDRGTPVSLALIVTGLAMLVGGGHLLVTSAVTLATALGVTEATIGLTVVAIGTSLPEAATSIIAAARGRGDIAVGNVIGSNLFNILGILGITAVFKPLAPGSITSIDLGMMLGVTVLTAVFILTHRRVGRYEGSFLVAAYIGYTAWLVVQ